MAEMAGNSLDVDRWVQRVKLRQLHLMAAVDAHRSLLGAAREIGISQPAVTKAMKDLEAETGVLLFERTNRGIVPTPYGAALTRHAKLVIAQLRHAGEELSDLVGGFGGGVVVGMLLAAAAAVLPRAIIELRKDRPNVRLTLIEGTYDRLIPALRQGDLDLVVGLLPSVRHREGLVQEPLYNETTVICVGRNHPLYGKKKVALEDLLAWDWIIPPPETTLRREIDLAFHSQGLDAPRASVESISLLNNKRLVLEADMIGAWPYQVIRDEIEAGMLFPIPLPEALSFGPVGIIRRRSGELSPATHALIDQLRSAALNIEASRS